MKRWLVTGASRGLGAEIAQAALDAGDMVAVSARSGQALATRFGSCDRAMIAPLDVTDEAAAIEVVRQVTERFGGVDILVNNAGYGVLGAIEEVSAAEFEQQYRTNVFGLLNVTRAVLPVMRRQRSGHIINMSSLGGYAAMPGWGAYHSSKFAVEGISESLRQEVAPLGIKVTVLEPVHFATSFMAADGLVTASLQIEDYDASSGEARRISAAAAHSGAGGADPLELAAALMVIQRSDTPPFRLPIGQRALDRMRQKHAEVEAEVERWHALCLLQDLR